MLIGADMNRSQVTPRIGVKLPFRFRTAGEFLADAQAYEAAGVHSLWVAEGTFRTADDAQVPPGLDPWTQLAAVAAVTSRVLLGTSVSIVAQWPPALFAQMITTLEHLSRARMIIGAGVGSERVQLEATGVPYEQRGARLDEFIEVVRRVWHGDPDPFEGRFYRTPAMKVVRAVREGGPPILVGGLSEPGFRRAARLGDGFIHRGGSPEQVKKEFDQVLHFRREAGRTGDFELWVQVRSPQDRDAWRETLQDYGQTGATGVIASHAPNLLDILRNPDSENDRQDLLIATG
jgi:alkanesulfonate monooxygenase SsuD/methylene tetrahydromethanopterin reductase-like flavin-dependent oxidoreductase (luciferase family)